VLSAGHARSLLGVENADQDGVVDADETSPTAKDSDGDGLDDDVEVGSGYPSAEPGVTQPTRGYVGDSDGDGLSDGQEDANENGRLDGGEASAGKYREREINLHQMPGGNSKQVKNR
jgi:hypothetical protein